MLRIDGALIRAAAAVANYFYQQANYFNSIKIWIKTILLFIQASTFF